MKQKIFTIVGLLVLGALMIGAGVAYIVFRSGGTSDTSVANGNQEVSTALPIDIALDFYDTWLEAIESTSTDPYTLGYASSTLLSAELRDRLIQTAGHAETEIDPVLCQTTVPEQVTGRIVSKQENAVRVLVMAKEKELTAQSVFTLKRYNDGWFIESIECAPGEFAPEREFSFDKEGYLLKNVLPPLDAQYWHIVFEDNGDEGHTAPLFFEGENACVEKDGNSAPCTTEQFHEADKVHIYGHMTERGVEVTKLEFIQ